MPKKKLKKQPDEALLSQVTKEMAQPRAAASTQPKRGFARRTKDKQFLKFDAEGNTKIVEALKASDKKDHLRVDVSGDVQGDTLKVTSIKLL